MGPLSDDLAGRTAIVTGGAGGLGAAIARGLAAAGVSVWVADLDGARAAAVAAGIGHDAVGVALDICSPDDTARLVERIGRLDILVNNAGVFGAEPWLAITAAESERLWRVNVLGLVTMTQAALPALVASGAGSIVSIASHTGVRANPASPLYSATKAAVISLTQSLALEFADRNVRANAIAPGAIDTPMFRAGQAHFTATRPQAVRPAKATVPLGRWSTPGDYVALALLLASPRSGYITGQTIGVNGGTVLH